MGRVYKRILFLLYTVAILVCGGLRAVFVVRFTDWETGFVNGVGGLPSLFNLVLAAALLLLFGLSLLVRVEHDYPVEHRQRLLSLLMLPVAAAIVLFSLWGIPADSILQKDSDELWKTIFRIANQSLGCLAGLAFLQAFFVGIRRHPRRPIALLMLAPSLWQLVVLVSRFNAYVAPTFAQDSLLAILYMCFAAVFFVGQSRTLCGLSRKNGRNYTVPAGLATSLCGLLLVLPNAGYLIRYQTLTPPAHNLTLLECVCVLLVSIYALAFVVNFLRSIRYV